MCQNNTISAPLSVIFDVGRVLVDFDLDKFRNFIVSCGARVNSVEAFIEQTNVPGFERGEISGESFLQLVQSILDSEVSIDSLQKHWNDIFSPLPEMLELLASVRRRHRVFLLSNTNRLHWEHLNCLYKLEDFVDGAVTSFEAGSSKPEKIIYQHAELKFKLNPQQIVFIDDIPAHVSTAQALGWKGIIHRGTEPTRQALINLGVNC